MPPRKAVNKRKTRETDIVLKLNIDGTGKTRFKTGIPFLEHMLDVMARQAMFDLDIQAKGDTEVDYHHLVEDIGLTFGMALAKALGNKAGIYRYGEAEVPLDEARVKATVKAVLDLSGRPYLVYDLDPRPRMIRDFDVQLMEEFTRSFCDRSRITLHLVQGAGKNNHHVLEAAFKALGLALRRACESDPRRKGVASTKGTLKK